VYLQREVGALAEELVEAITMLCAEPDSPVTAVPAAPFPAVEGLLTGHHSGVAIDPASTTALVTSVPGVRSCLLDLTASNRLLARVSATTPMSAADLLRAVRHRQPWWSGSVVPDDLVIAEAAHSSTHTTDASS
jgi:hypothetical protein